MFIDEVKIYVKAGDGGGGCMSFRREKFIPKGGPDGGDGGKGGSVYLQTAEDVDTLLDYSGRPKWIAKNGLPGSGANKRGNDGEDLVLKVPVGTQVYDTDLEDLLLVDLDRPDAKVCICKGGTGGLGNRAFATSTRQSPRFAQDGKPGKERNLKLVLKLIADVGLVGLPNAGKSTLLSRCSKARPKIADYPFTTLEPVLGIVEIVGNRRFVAADLPGLIQGAHKGAGLGINFLKHVERTRILVHLLDICPQDGSNPNENYGKIRNELLSYSKKLGQKQEVIVLNKIDTDPDGDLVRKYKKYFKDKNVFAISAATGQGIEKLTEKLYAIVKEQKKNGVKEEI